jgi:hypothetical protein
MCARQVCQSSQAIANMNMSIPTKPEWEVHMNHNA